MLNHWLLDIILIIIYGAILLLIIHLVVTEWIPKIKRFFREAPVFIQQLKHWLKIFRNLRRGNKMFTSDWLMEGCIETLFEQFRLFYEQYHANFYPVKEVMAPYWKGDFWNQFKTPKERQKYIDHLNQTEAAYHLINETYQYVAVTRQANSELVDSIVDEMFEDMNYAKDIAEAHKAIKMFKLKWHFSEYNHLIIDEKKLTTQDKHRLDWVGLMAALEYKDSEIAQKIITLRAFLTD